MRADELHLARLLEAAERCSVYMQASARKLPWPLSGEFLHAHRKDMDLFQAALRPALLATAGRLLEACETPLGIRPATDDFSAEFRGVLTRSGAAA